LAEWKEKRKIMQRYDATADGYDELHGEEQNAKYSAVLKKASLADKVVLDVGCGSGLFFEEAGRQATILVGIDISRKLLEKAKEKAHNFDNMFVLLADADRLPFCERFFDAVFAFTVLQNMPNPDETLTEIKRVSKIDSQVVVTALKKAVSLETFMDLLETAGFTVVSFVDDEALKCYVSVLTLNI
jgi:ubiquinone/menaquinone biosynthesis C-methylase UbiE